MASEESKRWDCGSYIEVENSRYKLDGSPLISKIVCERHEDGLHRCGVYRWGPVAERPGEDDLIPGKWYRLMQRGHGGGLWMETSDLEEAIAEHRRTGYPIEHQYVSDPNARSEWREVVPPPAPTSSDERPSYWPDAVQCSGCGLWFEHGVSLGANHGEDECATEHSLAASTSHLSQFRNPIAAVCRDEDMGGYR